MIERKPLQKSYEQELETARETFERIDHRMKDSDAVYVEKVSTADGESHVLCLSEGRARKENAMDGQAEQRFLEELERLQRSVTKGTIVKPEKWGNGLDAFRNDDPALRSIMT